MRPGTFLETRQTVCAALQFSASGGDCQRLVAAADFGDVTTNPKNLISVCKGVQESSISKLPSSVADQDSTLSLIQRLTELERQKCLFRDTLKTEEGSTAGISDYLSPPVVHYSGSVRWKGAWPLFLFDETNEDAAKLEWLLREKAISGFPTQGIYLSVGLDRSFVDSTLFKRHGLNISSLVVIDIDDQVIHYTKQRYLENKFSEQLIAPKFEAFELNIIEPSSWEGLKAFLARSKEKIAVLDLSNVRQWAKELKMSDTDSKIKHLIRIFKTALAPTISGYSAAVILSWIVGLVAGVLCLWFFDRFWKSDKRILGFGRKAWLALLLISIYPHGHFWFQGYSEPLFVSVLMLGLLAVASEKMITAGLLIGLSAIVRPQGVWLPPIWGLLLLWMGKQKKLPWPQVILAGSVSTLGVIGLLIWYWYGAGDPFYYYKIQAGGGYGRSFSLLGGIWNHHPRWDAALLYLYLSLFGSIRLIKRQDFLSRLVGWFSLAFTEVPLFFGGFYSYVRFLSVSLGMFILLTEEADRRSKWCEILIVSFFITKLAVQVYKSGFHEWVG